MDSPSAPHGTVAKTTVRCSGPAPLSLRCGVPSVRVPRGLAPPVLRPCQAHGSSPSLRSGSRPLWPRQPELPGPCESREGLEYPDASLLFVVGTEGDSGSGGRRASSSPRDRADTAIRRHTDSSNGPRQSRRRSSSGVRGHRSGRERRAFRRRVEHRSQVEGIPRAPGREHIGLDKAEDFRQSALTGSRPQWFGSRARRD
jgi:hypothetical protein